MTRHLLHFLVLGLVSLNLLQCAGGSVGTDNPLAQNPGRDSGNSAILALHPGAITDSLHISVWEASQNPLEDKNPLLHLTVAGNLAQIDWSAMDTSKVWNLELSRGSFGAIITGLAWENGQLMRGLQAVQTDTLQVQMMEVSRYLVYSMLNSDSLESSWLEPRSERADFINSPIQGTPQEGDTNVLNPVFTQNSTTVYNEVPSAGIPSETPNLWAYIAGTSFHTAVWQGEYPIFIKLPQGTYRVEVLDSLGNWERSFWIRVNAP